MKLLIQIAAVLVLMVYPFVAYIAMRILHAEGLDGDVRAVVGSLAVLLYPMAIALFFFYMRWPLLFIPPGVLLAMAAVVVLLALSPTLSLFINALRGIASSGYTVKANAVYWGGDKLEGADPATFEVIVADDFPQPPGKFARDAKRVYRFGYVLPGADPKTFEFLEDPYYTRDATRVFIEDEAIEGADAASFEWLRHDGKINWFWRDKNAVYFRKERVAQANAATFTLLSEDYGQDGARVFFRGDVVDGADVATFRHLNGFVGKDASRVFSFGEAVLADTDVARFTMRSPSLGDDGRSLYYFAGGGEPDAFEADAETIEELELPYAKDKDRVYYLSGGVQVVEGADAASFKAVGSELDPASGKTFDAEDKHRRYYSGQPLGTNP